MTRWQNLPCLHSHPVHHLRPLLLALTEPIINIFRLTKIPLSALALWGKHQCVSICTAHNIVGCICFVHSPSTVLYRSTEFKGVSDTMGGQTCRPFYPQQMHTDLFVSWATFTKRLWIWNTALSVRRMRSSGLCSRVGGSKEHITSVFRTGK